MRKTTQLPGRTVRLSSRQTEVMSLVIEGRTNQDIADALYLALSTVKAHLRRVYCKLSVHNRVNAYRRLSRLQLPPCPVDAA